MTVLLCVALVGAATAVVLLALRARTADQESAERLRVLAAARQSAVDLTSISHRQAAADIDRVLARATGELAEQFRRERPKLVTLLASTRATSRGTALAAGIVTLKSNSAQVLVAVDASVSNADTERSGKGPLVQRYRMRLTLREVGGRWLTERVQFAGAPA